MYSSNQVIVTNQGSMEDETYWHFAKIIYKQWDIFRVVSSAHSEVLIQKWHTLVFRPQMTTDLNALHMQGKG